MTETAPAKSKSALPFLLAFTAAAIGVYWFNDGPRKPETPVAVQASGPFSKTYATGAVAGVVVHDERREVPAFTFQTSDGKDTSLEVWKGKVILVNLWATWCAPCRKEMPDLSALQTSLGGADFDVVALSVDKKGAEASASFLKEVGASNLAVYTDTSLKSMGALQAIGLPATILIDRKGLEVARILGPVHWNAPEAQAMIKALMAETK